MNKIDRFSFNWLVQQINNKTFASHKYIIGGCVVDLGCGNSPYKEDISKISDQYYGVDWINSFHDLSNVDILSNLTHNFPLKDDYFDTVLSFQVMEHLAEPSFFLSECFRVLRPGGRILLTVPFMWHVHEAPYDYFRYTRHGLEYLFGRNGFSEITIEENTGFWQMWILKFNYHTARYKIWPIKLLLLPIWWLGQIIAPILDKFDEHPQETGSYTVVAYKP